MLKLFALLGGALLVMLLIIGVSLSQLRANMLAERENGVRSLIESILSIATYEYDQVKAGIIPEPMAKEHIRDQLRAARYGSGGYVFVIDTKGILQAHPLVPQYEGTNQLQEATAFDSKVMAEIIAKAKEGGGFTYYTFKRPGFEQGTFPKLTYSQIFEPWGWVLATGVYIDDIDDAFYEQISIWGEIVAVPLMLLFVMAYYLGLLIARPMRELEKAKESAESATRAKSDFLANMSHEIRTPLNGAMGMLALLLGTKMTVQQKEWAQIAYHSSEELLNLINDILDISKVESGHLVLEKVPFDLSMTIRSVTDLLYPRANRKGVELYVDLPAGLPRSVIGDSVRFRQILMNLVGNAVKFTHEGSIGVSLLCDEVDGRYNVRVEVKDTGVGIPQDKLGYVFEKFSQAEESTTRHYGGTGLGLAICRRLTALMGGDIGVHSVFGQGSRFWFTVMFDANPEEKPGDPLPRYSVNTGRLLVKTYKPRLADLIKTYGAWFGLLCEPLGEGQDLKTHLKQAMTLEEPYRFLVVDVDCLGQTAQAVSKEIEEFSKISPLTMPILLVSPDRVYSLEELALKKPVGLITKPVFPQDLSTIILRLSGIKARKPRQGLIMAHEILTQDQELGGDVVEKALEKTILIVEDQTINQLLMKTVIKKLGYQADMACNGIEAVRRVAEKKYDLVFMDCHMPEMDGFEATKQIRSFEETLSYHTPIVALTADAMVGDREKCLACGMDDYLRKPVKTEDLQGMIEKYA
ncbi:MAG: cache domain-containing protein [Bdellovibrionales bacterium]